LLSIMGQAASGGSAQSYAGFMLVE
ncbi:MAG: hypothetical protein QOF34_1345, partial [Sphingomonadales bacterium]|nr:hypothetical protein [Sphingomonadales bacterium]